jgi:hypothetical protein
MKTFNKSYLPETVEYNGERYYRNATISGVMNSTGTPISIIKESVKQTKRKMVLVLVLSNSLKGKDDLHGNPYQPTKWIFTTQSNV